MDEVHRGSPWTGGPCFVYIHVNMVVTSRCFAFRALTITQARIWKRFWVENLTSLLYYLPISSFAKTWIKYLYKHAVSIFFHLSWHFKREQSVFFAKQKLITSERLCVQDFTTGIKNFSFNQCHNKEFCVSFSGKLICESNKKLFSCICIAWYKHERGWENSALQTPKTFSIV